MKTDELLARIGLAWTRTFYFVMEGAFGDVALWDVGIIAATVVVGLVHHTASATATTKSSCAPVSAP